MKAVMLAGGLATRMRPVTDTVPKSLLPLMGVPFLEHQLDQLAAHGVTEAILLTGHLADGFGPFVDRMQRSGRQVEVSIESHPLGTAGAVRSVLDRLDGTALVMNTDALVAGLDWGAAIAQHRASGAQVTLTLVQLEDATGYGLVEYAEQRATGFTQLASGTDAGLGGWINAGYYVLESSVLADIPEDTMWSFETQVFPQLIASGAHVGTYASEGWWLDLGTPARYLRAHADVLDGKAQVRAVGRILGDVTLDDGTTIGGPTLVGHAKAGAGARLGPYAVIGDGAYVHAGAVIERTVIHGGAEIGEGAVLRNCIVGAGAVIEPGTTAEGAVLA
jgi:mannose-1-phosphate guanylyltransferase